MMKLNLNGLKILREISILALLLFFASSVFAKNYDSVGTKSYNTAAECRKDINAGKIHCELDASCKIAVNEVHRCCTWVNADNTANNNQSFSFAPFNGSPSARNSAPGKRARKVNGETKISHHDGYDYAIPQGTEVYAAADGKVSDVNECSGGAGRVIKILHLKAGSKQDYYTSVYMHLKSILVQKGNVVRKGQKIALSGGSNCSAKCPGKPIDSGYECSNGKIIKSTKKASSGERNSGYGPHLHFEVREGDSTKNRNAPVLDPACLASGNKVASNPTGLETYDMTAEQKQQTPLTSNTANYCPQKGCVYFFPADDLKQFTHRGESHGDYAAFNKCNPNDDGGCTYGAAQLTCNGGMFKPFLKELQKEKTLWNELGGGSYESMVKRACSGDSSFVKAWASVGPKTAALQDRIVNEPNISNINRLLPSCKKYAPEVQMLLWSFFNQGLSNKHGNHLTNIHNVCKRNLSDEAVIKEISSIYRDYLNHTLRPKLKNSGLERRKLDEDYALKSLAIRKELEKNPGKSADEIAKQLYNGKCTCKEGQSTSGSYGGASGGGGGSSTIAVPQGDKGDRECNVSSYRDSYVDCMFCDLFGILFETASGVAKKAYTALADAMAKIVLLGFAIWVSITILKFVSAMEQKEPRIMIKTLLNQAFVVIVVVIFLKSDATTFFGMAMEPIFNTGMKLAQSITDGGSCKNDFGLNDNGGLPISMGVNILCTIKAVQDKLLDVMALGSTSLCVGFFVESWRGWPIFPHMGYVIVGLVLWISALLFMVIYPFLLIDAVLQLSVATALLPMAVAAYAFPITRKKYVGKIWETFLNCMFSFVFLSIIVFILSEALTGRLAASFERTNTINAGTSSGYEVILSGLAWWGTTFLELVFIMLIGWAVLGEAKSLAENFAGTIGVGKDDIGSNVGTLAMSGVKGVAKPTVLGAGRLAGKGLSAVGNTAKEKVNNARIGFQAWRMKNNSNATLDENGNIVVNSKSWFLRRNVTKVLSTDASGRQSISRTKTKGNGASTTTKTDTFFSVKEQRDKNGNVTSRQTEMKAAGGKYMINKDGSVNQVALHSIRNGSTHDADTVNEALLNQMLAERMPGIEGATLNGSFSQRNVRSFKDDKGRDVFEVSQVNKDGTRSNFKMTLSGNRALTEYETITKKGEAVKYSSDGIVNKKSSYQYNKDGVNGEFGSVAQNTVKNKFSFTSYYDKMGGRPMDSLGNISGSVPKDEIMFGAEDMKAFQDQIARKGHSGPLGGFK